MISQYTQDGRRAAGPGDGPRGHYRLPGLARGRVLLRGLGALSAATAAVTLMTLPVSTPSQFRLAGWLGSGWSTVVEELVDGEQFAAWAVAAGSEAAAGPGAVRAPLVAEVAGVAAGALVDGALAAGPGRRRRDGSGFGGVAAPPGGLAAGAGA